MRRVPAAIFVVLMLALTGCAQKASAAERIAAAPEATTQAGTALMSLDVTSEGGAQPFSMTGEGAIDFAAQRAAMKMSLGGEAAQLGDIEVRTDGSILYLKIPNAEQIGVDTPWLKMDLEQIEGTPAAQQFSQFNNDPSDSMQVLRGVSDDVTEVGAEEVRGAPKTHYRATLNLNKALETAPAEAQDAIRQQVETLGVDTLPVDVWIDEEGRMRRQVVEVDLSKIEQPGPAPAPGAPTSLTTTYEMFDFGAQVDVAPPPADEVTDFAETDLAG